MGATRFPLGINVFAAFVIVFVNSDDNLSTDHVAWSGGHWASTVSMLSVNFDHSALPYAQDAIPLEESLLRRWTYEVCDLTSPFIEIFKGMWSDVRGVEVKTFQVDF